MGPRGCSGHQRKQNEENVVSECVSECEVVMTDLQDKEEQPQACLPSLNSNLRKKGCSQLGAKGGGGGHCMA